MRVRQVGLLGEDIVPDEIDALLGRGKLDPYQALGIRVTSEIRYQLEEDVDAAGIENVEFIKLQGADDLCR